MRLVQITHPVQGRRVALVEKASLILIHEKFTSVYDLVWKVLSQQEILEEEVQKNLTATKLSYDWVYSGKEAWRVLPSFDHPYDPLHCLVSGTGLTHKASAQNRALMHQKIREGAERSDSMKMYLLGEEGGKPPPGKVGVQPEWFYKGNGSILRGHLSPLEIPPYALDGGEEPEIAGAYVVDPQGVPVRIGMTVGNEFSDHVMEQRNYLYLAPSKLRQCAIGPELVTDPDFSEVRGTVAISRKGAALWSKEVHTGENGSTHSVENLEYHHFKYAQHRIPGQVHIHFYGASGLSFSEGIRLEDGDEMIIEMGGFGRPLKNPVSWSKAAEQLIELRRLK